MNMSYKKTILRLIGFLLMVCNVWSYAASPVWTFSPLTANTTTKLPVNGHLTVRYAVTNQSKRPLTLTVTPVAGINQIETQTFGNCSNPFTLGAHQSCSLNLEVIGNALQGDVINGPVVCNDGNPFQCYQPSQVDSLNISLSPASAPSLVSIAVQPSAPSMNVGETLSFSAIGTYSDGSSQSLTAPVWSSSNPSIVTINSSGLAAGLSTMPPHYSDITATVDGVAGQTQLDVLYPPLRYVVVDLNSVNATLTPFGGELASLTSTNVPPGGPGGVVAMLTKPSGSQTFAGTTMSTGADFSVPIIPFSGTNYRIAVQLYVPTPNVPIKLKVENTANPSQSVETDMPSTVSGWQTLIFNFANPSPSTPPLNLSYTYNRIVIFPDYGSTGNNATYYIGPSIFIGASQGGP